MKRGWRFRTVFLSTAALAAAGAMTVTPLPAAATAVDTVFVVPGSHLDLGFTGPLSEVRERRIRILDLVLETAERDSSFVWFEEGGWSVEQWLDRYARDARRIARLRKLVLSGRVGVGATLLSRLLKKS